MTEKPTNKNELGIETQVILGKIYELTSAIEKLTVEDTKTVSQSDQLKYQVAGLAEAMHELEVRIGQVERHRHWVSLVGVLVVTVIVVLATLWLLGVFV